MSRSIASLTIFFALAALDVSAGPLLNGSFETTSPAVVAGTCGVFASGSSGITSWTVVGGGASDVAVCNTTFTQFGISFPAQNGSNSVDLTGLSSNLTEGVQQTVTTTIGDLYLLSFYVGNVDSPSTGFGVTSTVDVSANGTSLGAFTNNCTTCTTVWAWQQFSPTFTATSASTILTFLNGDPANDNANGLDNVVLTDNGPAVVPEPSTLSLLVLGGIGVGLFRRRKTA